MIAEGQSQKAEGLLLCGLDGSNPLAFLAALGTLRVANLVWARRGVRLSWVQHAGAWSPKISIAVDPDTFVDGITWYCQTGLLKTEEEEPVEAASAFPYFAFDRNTSKIEPERFRQVETDARRSSDRTDRSFVDFVAAIGSDACVEDGFVQDTGFRTMSGQGHQNFLGTMLTLAEDVERQYVQSTLLVPWHYEDPLKNHSMRWDPNDDKRHAYQWTDPTHNSERKTGGMWGANRLAVEALPLLPTAPTTRGLHTTAFNPPQERWTRFRWPVWSPAITVETCGALLAVADLQAREIPRPELRAIGVEEVFESRRIVVGYYRNFTPARAV